ncbi:putative Elongation factor 1-gamma [Blattamonas nauphoetae]|uniref:Elongation factor 1-gamma n=1 Tax=Blattamonas nauphoetae TaxID=2049346 RepID=A0ABQ9YKE6_9EUKA|nr:putative Elongation factor 1-gamma [Blattamonas nauphoetae]
MSCCAKSGCEGMVFLCEEGTILKKLRVIKKVNKLEAQEMTDIKAAMECNQEMCEKFNPFHVFPCVNLGDAAICGQEAVFRFLCRKAPADACLKLSGQCPVQEAQVDMWMNICATQVESQADEVISQIDGTKPFNPKFYQDATKSIKTVCSALEKHLLDNTFLVGERITFADVDLAFSLGPLFSRVFDAKERNNKIAVTRWIQTVLNHTCIKEVYGSFALCEKAQEPKRPEKPKKEQPKKVEAPKEEVPEPESEEEPEAPAENPDEPLDMEWWKRCYSNTPVPQYPEAFAKLYHKLDDIDKWENFSIYFCEYKYPEDFKQTFQLCNLVSGFLQRNEAIRKIAFGTVLICQDNDKNLHSIGAWLWKDKEIPKDMIECPDYPSWTFWKFDPAKAEDRKLFEEINAWEGSFGGRNWECKDGKTFK